MGPLAGRFLLESILAPGLVAGLALMVVRGWSRDRSGRLAPALAIILAVGVTYVLAFGWPPNFAGGARSKVMLSALIGLVVGVALHRRAPWSGHAFTAAAIGIPIWIGLPALQLGKPESALLLLPIAAIISARAIGAAGPPPHRAPGILILVILAVSLSTLAAFAKAFSFAEIGLALASALVAILAIERAPLGAPATTVSAFMLLAVTTALLLYSEVSILALSVLALVPAAERFARRGSGSPSTAAPIGRVLVFCLLPAGIALLVARIDAGPISIY